MKAIGGYFELESQPSPLDPFKHLYKLNTCRHSLLYLLQMRGITSVAIPYYTCAELELILRKNGIETYHYSVDERLEPIGSHENPTHAFIYTNYFGLKDAFIKTWKNPPNHLIIDNAQALFSNPPDVYDCIYSPRKFMGLPDGGLLRTNIKLDLSGIPFDVSYNRMDHLLKRFENEPESGYADYKRNDADLAGLPVARMSKLTTHLMRMFDFHSAAKIRRRNFLLLHEHLAGVNRWMEPLADGSVPLIYPLWINGQGEVLRKKLIDLRIFVATYWPEVLSKVVENSTEHDLVTNLVALPIDHRYSEEDMVYLANTVNRLIS